MADQAEDELLRRATQMQALHVYLLFCERTRAAWREAPEKVLAAFNLPADAGQLFADIESAQFIAESHGRRVGVERAAGRWFPKTHELLEQRRKETGSTPPGHDFDDFLCSDFFLDPRQGIPHTSGIGAGYEAASKYFFWLRAAFGMTRPETDVELRTTAYTEFAFYLINQYRQPHDGWYDRFKGGTYWQQVPGQEIPVLLLSDKFVIFTLNNREIITQLPNIGLVDIDDLHPPFSTEETDLI